MSENGREIRQSTHMTETEALMWAAESDPWLSAGMGSVFVLDEQPDFEAFLAKIELASHSMLRLRERVVDGLGLAPPRWVIDEEFDITEHVRHVQLPRPGGTRELLDLAAQVFQDPFDIHRPLWQFVVVDGAPEHGAEGHLAGGIIMKLHHAVSDGIGALRLAEMYLDFERHPPSVDAIETERAGWRGTSCGHPGHRPIRSRVPGEATTRHRATRRGRSVTLGCRPVEDSKCGRHRCRAREVHREPARIDRFRGFWCTVVSHPVSTPAPRSIRCGAR